MKTVCHFTSVHPRYDPRIFLKQCTSLAKIYTTYLVVADGLGDEQLNGVKIIDVGSREKSKIKRIIYTTYKVYKAAKAINADLYEFHDPELLFWGFLLKKQTNKIIFDMHEDTPGQILVRDWIPAYLKKIIVPLYKSFENQLLKRLDAVYVPQEFMQKNYAKVNTTIVIHNYLLNDFYPNIEPKKSVSALLYVGSISLPRGILNMLNMVSKTEAQLTIAGSFADKKTEQLARNHPAWQKINYVGVLTYKEVRKLYHGNFIGLIPFNNLGQYKHSHVIKLFEYMAFGLPVVMPNFGDWPSFNKLHRVGKTTNTENEDDFSKTVNNLLKSDVLKFSTNGRSAVKEHFLWDSVEKELFNSYETLLL